MPSVVRIRHPPPKSPSDFPLIFSIHREFEFYKIPLTSNSLFHTFSILEKFLGRYQSFF